MEKNKKVESAESTKKSAAKAKTTTKKATKSKIIEDKKISTSEKKEGIEKKVVEKTNNKKSIKANSTPKDYQSIKDSIEAKVNAFFDANQSEDLRKLVSASKLMEAGSHIGTPAKLWNPKMAPFVYSKKGGKTQIIDVLKTLVFLNRAYNFLKDISKEGGRVLFVGTRGSTIKEHIKSESKRVKSYYINQRWLGGTLTNYRTISKSIDKLNKLIALQLSDEVQKYTKKEQIKISKETEKLAKFFGGIRTMRSLPQAIVVTDPVIEKNAIIEAKKMRIPVVAIANTNADPSNIDFIIPANSSSIRTVYLIISILSDAIAEAHNEPLSIIGKKDEEIILPEVAKKVQSSSIVSHKRFSK